jgi:hypothetical protein
MQKIIISIFILLLLTGYTIAQTPGTLTVMASTSSAGGNYAPRNIVAVWIEDDQGNFIKTLMAYAQTRRTHLNTWEASTTAAGSPFNTVDAITGPTRNSHGTRTSTWDGTDVEGNVVDDGTYHVWMELTDKNGTGNFSSFSFSKGLVVINLNPLNVPSFSSISINWEPIFTSVADNSREDHIKVFPNPTSGEIHITGENVLKAEIRNAAGKRIEIPGLQTIDLSDQADGIYFLRIFTENGISTKKIIKRNR